MLVNRPMLRPSLVPMLRNHWGLLGRSKLSYLRNLKWQTKLVQVLRLACKPLKGRLRISAKNYI